MRSLVFLLVFACAACDLPTPSTTPPSAVVAPDPAAVGRVLDEWHAAAAAADEAKYFSYFAPNGVFLGTDGTERWPVDAFRTYAHPHFAKGKAWTMKSTHRDITFSSSGDTAWFDESLDTVNLGPSRGSGVLVRDASGAWKIAQYNLSVPIPNDRFEAVKTLISR